MTALPFPRLSGLLVVVLLVLAGSCGGSSWDQAVEKANRDKKLLIVEFYATWCKPCHWFEKNVLADAEVVTALEGVEFHRYDFDTTAGQHHARRLGVRGVPSVVAVGRDGKAFRMLKGAVHKSKFLEFLDWSYQQVYP